MVSKKPKLLAAGHPDNFQSPDQAASDIAAYLPKDWLIWEPACGKGNLVRGLEERGYKVYGSDILLGRDFLHMDCKVSAIVTNPPFSIKQKFLARCYELGNPFALLLPITTLGHGKMRKLMDERGIQVLLPDGRYNFETPNGAGSSSWFYTAWFCWGLNLPKQMTCVGTDNQLNLRGKEDVKQRKRSTAHSDGAFPDREGSNRSA